MKYSKNKTSKSEIPTVKIKCLCGCGKTLTPVLDREIVKDPNAFGGERSGDVLKIKGYGYDANNYFQSLRCGFRYAVRIAKNHKS